MQISFFKQIINVFSLLFFIVSPVFSQSTENLMPYNPDSDGNGSIEVGDLVGFLTLFGGAFVVEGALPIENGGTGAITAEDARLALTISLFSDISPLGEGNPSSQITGDLTLTGKLQQGSATIADGDYSIALGVSTSATGYASYAEGQNTAASNTTAHAEGYGTLASGLFSHAENRNSTATATCAHAEGENTSATADASHSEGMNTLSSGFTAHSEGYGSIASASYSHSGGRQSTASATGSFAHGFQLIADQTYSTALGKYNLSNRTGTILVVGNGIDDSLRSNIFEIDAVGGLINGDFTISGSITANGVDLVNENAALSNSIFALETEISTLDTLILNLQEIVAGLQSQINLLSE
jgi:hypothetical protein